MESFRARSAAIQPPASEAHGDASGRLIWIDWLKVFIVFGVFVYHCAEPFVLINWLVSNGERSVTLSAVAGFGYLFGMPLMFLLAGATAWLSLGRRSLQTYGLVRVQRLLVPLVVGILLLTPFQWWLAAAIDRGGENPLTTVQWFYSGIRFEPTPRWFGDYGMHLWFLAFLFAYSILCLPLLGALRRPVGGRLLAWLGGLPTPAMLVVLLAPILASQWLLRLPTPSYRDWADFMLWLGFFAVGVVLIADSRLLNRVARSGPALIGIGLAVILASLAVVGTALATGVIPAGRADDLTMLETAPGLDLPSFAYITVRTVSGAALVGGALWIGMRWFSWRWPGLPRASRAILPFYVLHHPVVVAAAAVVVKWPMGVWPKFAVILVSSLAGSLALTELTMRTRLGRALFGIPAPEPPPPTGSGPALESADRFGIHAGEPLPATAPDAARSVIDVLRATVQRHPHDEAIRWKQGGRWTGLSYAALWDRVRAASLGLRQRGLAVGDHVLIVSRSRPEWVVADFAALALGAVVCPIYSGESDARIEEVARGLRPRLIFVEDERQRSRFGDIAPTVLLAATQDGQPGATSLADLERAGRLGEPTRSDAWESGLDRLHRSMVATIVQTIDEEGVSRGAVLSHGNVLHNLVAARGTLPLRHGDVMLSLLPLSHMLERSAVLIGLSRGATIAFAESRIDRWADNMREVRPHAVATVPLFIVHLVRGMRSRSVEQTGLIGRLASWSVRTGAAARGDSGLVGRGPRLRLWIADQLVLRHLRAATGGRLRYLCCGGAPLPPDANRFLSAVGIPVIEGYGMTETSPILTLNRLGHQRSGTVGRPVAGTELRIEPETGEVLARGPQVMLGYHDLPAQTAATLDAEGWLRTGDLGEWDPDGNLRLTGVRKDLLVLATGKKVSPRPLEAALESSDLIARAAVVDLGGEGLGALIWPDPEAIASHAALEGATHQELVIAEVRRLLGGHATYERPRRLGILPRDLSAEAGELAGNGRRNRAVIVANWAGLATIPLSWRSREPAEVSVIPSPIGAVSSAG